MKESIQDTLIKVIGKMAEDQAVKLRLECERKNATYRRRVLRVCQKSKEKIVGEIVTFIAAIVIIYFLSRPRNAEIKA